MNAFRIVAARSVLAGGFSVALFQFIATILYLFCVPSMEVMATLNAPQPFVLVYSLALGRGGATFMAILSTLNYTLVRISSLQSSLRKQPPLTGPTQGYCGHRNVCITARIRDCT